MNIVTDKRRQRSAPRPGPEIFKAGFFLILFLFLTLALGRAEAGAYDTGTAFGGTPTVVNNGPGNQTDPHVDGDIVSYTSAADGVSQIRYFNFATGIDNGILGVPGALDFLSDVSGGTIVFTRIEGSKQSVWAFSTATAGPAVELAPSATSQRRGAAIGGSTIAWQDLGFSTSTSVISETLAYDLNTGVATRLTDDTLYDRVIAVSPDGNVIVWDKCATSTTPCDIWQAVKGATGWTVTQVTDTPDPESFSDTNGTIVVYGGIRAGNATGADIYWRPVAGGPEVQLALVGEQRNPNISGNLIAFEGRNLADTSPNWDIYLYDLSAQKLYRMTDTPSLHEVLNDISVAGNRGRVVWSVLEADHNVYASTFSIPTANAGPDQSIHPGNVVTLDGSGSTDPDNNYPLTYSWTMTTKPAWSRATLSDPAVVNPSFTADNSGTYVVTLVVTDSLGLASAPASVTVSTTNTAPVADAGPDQSITMTGSTVQLDGTQSYDVDGDKIIWSWSFTQLPAGSNATISYDMKLNVTPSFVADVAGTYVVELVVNDPWVSSDPDTMTVSFTNVKPVADAGGNQSVSVGDTVVLNGGASSDANGDALAYSWSFVSVPAGSTAAITGPLNSIPYMASFVADVAGTYVASLVVNDGTVDSDPSNATVVATAMQDSVIQVLKEALYAINHLAPGSLKNDKMANTLTNKISAAIQMIDQGLYQDALDKLTNDILGKTDGCAITGSPDNNDWLTNCASQGEVYPLIIEAIDLLRLL